MSEAARHVRDTNNILEIISKVSARISSGVSVPLLSKMISEGHIAFFFDGLDEIGSFEDRQTINHEMRHATDMRVGKLAYSDDHVMYNGEKFELIDQTPPEE